MNPVLNTECERATTGMVFIGMRKTLHVRPRPSGRAASSTVVRPKCSCILLLYLTANFGPCEFGFDVSTADPLLVRRATEGRLNAMATVYALLSESHRRKPKQEASFRYRIPFALS